MILQYIVYTYIYIYIYISTIVIFPKGVIQVVDDHDHPAPDHQIQIECDLPYLASNSNWLSDLTQCTVYTNIAESMKRKTVWHGVCDARYFECKNKRTLTTSVHSNRLEKGRRWRCTLDISYIPFRRYNYLIVFVKKEFRCWNLSWLMPSWPFIFK